MTEAWIPGKEKCWRCGRWFTPKLNEKYGPVCVKKVSGSRQLLDGTIEVRDRKGDITAVIV